MHFLIEFKLSYLANEQKCLSQSTSLVWDGDQCVDREEQPNFYRYCKESSDIEIRKIVNVVRYVLDEKSCEGAFAKLKITNSLTLEYRFLKNLKPLDRLTHLKELSVKGNQISDLSNLKDMTRLTSLNLDDNQINDISVVANLLELEEVSIKNNPVFDLRPLGNLEKLKVLHLNGDILSHHEKYICPDQAKSKVLTELCTQIKMHSSE
ncbi:MAG: leucine-rich repeat domain-containing protein [Oligoflexales bacterium]|nr:leucine-rich repeat domain-containing protein [Oligoflexales bacterium]